MGFVCRRPSRTRGTHNQAVAVIDGARVQLGTFVSVALATDAWRHAETAARRGAGDPRAGRLEAAGCRVVQGLLSDRGEPGSRRRI